MIRLLRRLLPTRWAIYYAETELARLLDDVCLGTVRARSRVAAIRKAVRKLHPRFPDSALLAGPAPAQRWTRS